MKNQLKSVVISVFAIALLLTACGSDGGSSKSPGDTTDPAETTDTTAPSKIYLTGISATSTNITFTWTDPSDSDFDHAVITCSDGTNSESENVAAGKKTLTKTTLKSTALSASTPYAFTIKSADRTGNLSKENAFYVKTNSSTASITFKTISTASELNSVRDTLGGNYLLLADIDLSTSYSLGWTSIGIYASGSTSYFTGIFNGNGHVIKNLYINNLSETGIAAGLFAYTLNATICSLGLESVNVTCNQFPGTLVGFADSCTIINCFATGSDTVPVGQHTSSGGLVGVATSCTIINCYAAVDAVNKGDYQASSGGLVGTVNYSTITNCFATGSVTGGTCSGGLVGTTGTSKITNCYATGAVTSSSTSGGLVGGADSFTTTNCYYDSSTTGESDTGKGIPFYTSGMKLKDSAVAIYTNIYVDWDFSGETANGTEEIWSIDTTGTINDGYPYLTNNPPK